MTFLLADVEGSVAMWEADRDAASRAIQRLESMFESVALRNEGQIVKKRGEGDSFFLVFASPISAVRAAIGAQKLVLAEPSVGKMPIRVRMAIRTGDAEFRNGDFFGPTINRCARMRSSASGGEIVICEATSALIAKEFLQDAEVVELGTFRLKDVPGPEKLFGVRIKGVEIGYRHISIEETAPHNIPPRLTTFLGRETEIEHLKAAIRSKRLVTVIGPGGSGKTRLSQEVGERLCQDFLAGVWFAGLQNDRTDESILRRIADSVPGSSMAGEISLEGLTAKLIAKHALLILDNCEHILGKVLSIAHALLLSCPKLKILATSRKPLGLAEEQVFVLHPFPTGTAEDSQDPDRLLKFPAVALFVERARQRLPEFTLSAANAAAVQSICAHLDGIPLAIEQAASHVARLSPEQIEGRLSDRFRLLRLPADVAEARHVTMRATIEWSVDLLNEDARKLFFALSVFAGGWDLEAVEHVGCGLGLCDPLEVHGDLIDASLVQFIDDELTGRRYRYLETIREFAVEGLADDAARGLHADWFIQHASKIDSELVGGRQSEWIRRAENDLDNLRQAMGWLRKQNDERLPKMANFMKRTWLRLGLYREGAACLEEALASGASDEPRLRATLLNALGACLWRLGDWEAAEKNYTASLDLWEALGDEAQIGALNTNLAICATEREAYGEALALYERSVEIYARLGDDRGLGSAMMNLGHLQLRLGDFQTAKETLDKALAHAANAKHGVHLGFAQGNLAIANWKLNDVEGFASAIRCCIDRSIDAHDAIDIVTILGELTTFLHERNLKRAAEKASSLGNRLVEAFSLSPSRETLQKLSVAAASKTTESETSTILQWPEIRDSLHLLVDCLTKDEDLTTM